MKKCVHTHFPRSHEAPNLLQISSSNNILEDDVIGEVHSPLGGYHGYDRCRGLLRLFALSWSATQSYAVCRAVRGCSFVGGCVLGWGGIRSAVLCRGVLWHCSIRRCVCRWGVVRRAVIRWCVVRRCVLGAPRVCRQWYVVVVLHPCRDCCFVPSFSLKSGGLKERNPNEQNNPMKSGILCPFCLQLTLSFEVPAEAAPFLHFNNSSFLTHSFVLIISSSSISSLPISRCTDLESDGGKTDSTSIYPLRRYFEDEHPVTSAFKRVTLIQLHPLM